jgi:hypothetical protein
MSMGKILDKGTGVELYRIEPDESLTYYGRYVIRDSSVDDSGETDVTLERDNSLQQPEIIEASAGSDLNVSSDTSYEMDIFHDGITYRCIVMELMEIMPGFAVFRVETPFSSALRRSHERHSCMITAFASFINDDHNKEDHGPEEKYYYDDEDEKVDTLKVSRYFSNRSEDDGITNIMIINIGAGGCKILTEEPMTINTMIKISPDFSDGEKRGIMTGRVIRTRESINYPGKYESNISYVTISEKLKEVIIKMVFMYERDDMKERL